MKIFTEHGWLLLIGLVLSLLLFFSPYAFCKLFKSSRRLNSNKNWFSAKLCWTYHLTDGRGGAGDHVPSGRRGGPDHGIVLAIKDDEAAVSEEPEEHAWGVEERALATADPHDGRRPRLFLGRSLWRRRWLPRPGWRTRAGRRRRGRPAFGSLCTWWCTGLINYRTIEAHFVFVWLSDLRAIKIHDSSLVELYVFSSGACCRLNTSTIYGNLVQ
jgi:hypothetical protein